jgi:hypothetical protein
MQIEKKKNKFYSNFDLQLIIKIKMIKSLSVILFTNSLTNCRNRTQKAKQII